MHTQTLVRTPTQNQNTNPLVDKGFPQSQSVDSRRLSHRPEGVPVVDQRVAIQLCRSASPGSPDFSGWNCVDHTTPSSTAATNLSSPYDAHVTFAPLGDPS